MKKTFNIVKNLKINTFQIMKRLNKVQSNIVIKNISILKKMLSKTNKLFLIKKF